MIERTGKSRKRYVDHPNDISKLTFIIHGPGHSSDGCKVLGGFGTKYYKVRTTKDRMQEPETKKRFGRQQENKYVVQHADDDIILK